MSVAARVNNGIPFSVTEAPQDLKMILEKRGIQKLNSYVWQGGVYHVCLSRFGDFPFAGARMGFRYCSDGEGNKIYYGYSDIPEADPKVVVYAFLDSSETHLVKDIAEAPPE